MGLLSRISNMNKSKGGLLALAEKFELTDIDFHKWASSKNLSICGIFSKEQSFYYVSNCYGFDLSSIINSVSTEDFWNGTVTDKDDWNDFEGASLTPFFQLFSSGLKNFISKLSVLPFTSEANTYYFVVCEDFDKTMLNAAELKQDLSKIVLTNKKHETKYIPEEFVLTESINRGLEVSPANLFILSSKLSFENAFNQFEKNIRQKITVTAMTCLYNQICSLFQAPNCSTLGTNSEIKIVLFAKEEIDEKLLQFHINSSLKNFFNNENDCNVLVLTAGLCPNLKGTTVFLTQD